MDTLRLPPHPRKSELQYNCNKTCVFHHGFVAGWKSGFCRKPLPKAVPSIPGMWSDPLLWKLGVSSVAERGIPGSFALAEEGLAILFRGEGLRREIRSTMRAVAERLASGFAAATEVIGLAGLKFHTNGLTGCYLGFTHTLRTQVNRS